MAETDEIPTLTQLLIELSKSWNSYWLTKTTSADNPVHNLVLTKIPSVLKSWAGSNSKLKFEGSDGRGNLVRTPWVATFNLDITSSATRGFYPVYLFRDNMKEMVLEVGFGATQFEEVYGGGAKFFEELQKAVIGMQNSSTHLLEVLDKPVRERISLKPTVLDESDDFKLKAYEKCSIYSLHYALDNLPSEDQLKYDYLQILKLYDLMANSVVLPSEEEYVLEQTKSPRVIDLTDGEKGLRLVIEIKNGHEPQKVLEDLYRLTPMEESFAINNVALVEGRPRTLGLKELLEVYLEHRIDVVKRRSKFRLEKATARLHLVEGMLLAIVDIDKVIKIIRASDDAAEAKTALMKGFKLSDIQTTYILEMPLRRLTKTSKIELQTEQKQLLEAINELKSILGSTKKLRKSVADELAAVAQHFATPRRSTLVSESGKVISEAAKKPEDLVLV